MNTLVDVMGALVEDDPEATALYEGHAGALAPDPVTRARLWAETRRLAAVLHELGVGDGDAVGVWLPNWSTSVAAQLAASWLGAHVIGINTRYNAEEVGHVLRGADPAAVLIAHDFNDLDLVGRLRSALGDAPAPALVVVPAPGEPGPADLAGYDLGGRAVALDEATSAGDPPTPVASPGLAAAFTTSGSTGLPKLAAHTDEAVTVHSLAAGARMGLGRGSLVLGALPLSGVFGFNASYAALCTGAAVLLEPVFDAGGVLADMAATGVTHVVGADDLIGRLAVRWREDRPPLALRWIGYADFEGRSRELAEWAETEFDAVTVGVYGSSELFALTMFWDDADPADLRRAGGGRLTLPAAEVRVADPLTGAEVPAGDEGEMQFRGPNVVDRYLGDVDGRIAEAAFAEEGWFRSGDLGVRVDDRAVRYVCRMGDALRLRGFLVDPAEIELRLLEHEAVRVVKVVGVPSEADGTGPTVAVAFVVAVEDAPRPSGQELRDWCARTLASFKVPQRVEFLGAMPTTAGTNGTKIRAAALRDLARDRLRA